MRVLNSSREDNPNRLPKILPKYLDKTIVLDTDVTLANDISKVTTFPFYSFDDD